MASSSINFFAIFLIAIAALIPGALATTNFIQTTIAPNSYYYWTVYSTCEYVSMTSYCSPYSCNLLVFSTANFALYRYQRDNNKTTSGVQAIYKSSNTPTYTYSASSDIISNFKGLVIVLENPNHVSGVRAELNLQESYTYSNIMGTITAVIAPTLCCVCICCVCCCVTCFICCSKKKNANTFGRSSNSSYGSYSSLSYQPAFVVQKPNTVYAYPQHSQMQLLQQQQQPVISLLPSSQNNYSNTVPTAMPQQQPMYQQQNQYYAQQPQPTMYYQQQNTVAAPTTQVHMESYNSNPSAPPMQYQV